MDEEALRLFGGLLWYLEARNWAFDKMKDSPHGANVFDVRLHHSLFFVNLMSAVDHVADCLKYDKTRAAAFVATIEKGFGNTDDYIYVRELRNSIVHRGFDPSAAALSDQSTLLILCPLVVKNQSG